MREAWHAREERLPGSERLADLASRARDGTHERVDAGSLEDEEDVLVRDVDGVTLEAEPLGVEGGPFSTRTLARSAAFAFRGAMTATRCAPSPFVG